MLDDELIGRPDPEQHRHAAIAAIGEAAPSRVRPILLNRPSPYIAESAPIEVPRCAVVHGMSLLPVAEGKQRNQSEASTHPMVGAPTCEVRAVAAIVLNDE